MLTYGDIISENCERFYPQWWPKYAYHFTDVTNAINILSLGRLYSRFQANQRGLIRNDNASIQVINMTETRAKSYARFYFRPLTPTQYHNEGYKHSLIRYDGDANANVPVPIFFVFDLEELLSTEGVVFSPTGQAGHGGPVYQGVESFVQLPFDKIYNNTPCNDEIRRYRHAEILCPDFYPIGSTLKMILCRNECEKSTFLNMLSNVDPRIYYMYKDYVRVARKYTFQRNGLFIDSVVCNDNMISFTFSDTLEKRRYVQRYAKGQSLELSVTFHFQWVDKRGAILYSANGGVWLDYVSPDPVVFTQLPTIKGATILKTTITIDGKIICVSKHPIALYEMI